MADHNEIEPQQLTEEEWRRRFLWDEDSVDALEATSTERADEDGPGARRSFAGFDVVIESPKGSVREWVDTDGTAGRTKMRYDYGYIIGSRGADGDSLDVYLGPEEAAPWAYVVHQQRKPDFVEYDEDKVMLGFASPDAARKAYLAQYDDERFFGGMTMMSLDDLRAHLESDEDGDAELAELAEQDGDEDTEWDVPDDDQDLDAAIAAARQRLLELEARR